MLGNTQPSSPAPNKPGAVLPSEPANYLGFITFYTATVEELAGLGGNRRGEDRSEARVAARTVPTAAWRGLGLKALPGKSKSSGGEVKEWTRLRVGGGFRRPAGAVTQDQLQAADAWLGILALAEGNEHGYEGFGEPPFRWNGH